MAGAMTMTADSARTFGWPDVEAPVVELKGVSVVRRGRTLLDGVDWTVRAGERWVVLGSNGAGKTTLVQVCAGAIAATTGQVAVLGESLDEADLDDLLPRIGHLSSALADSLGPRMPVLDVVLTAATASLVRRPEDFDELDAERARELLAQVGCRTVVGRRYGTLSEGERKRVQVARALMADPELLLLDEPAAGLDLGAREALLRRLSRLAADPAAPATVLVTHHVEEIPAGFTHALLLRAGTVVAAGPIERVVTGAGLSKCFGFPLVVDSHGCRFAARAAPAPL